MCVEMEQIASHKNKNYFMKSKYFSNDFGNKTGDFFINVGY
jgi:hypothetical protein